MINRPSEYMNDIIKSIILKNAVYFLYFLIKLYFIYGDFIKHNINLYVIKNKNELIEYSNK